MALTQLEKAPRKGVYQKPKAKFVADPILGDKALREEAVVKMTVTISTGKTFDADPTARINIMASILASDFLGQVSTVWRLSNNEETEVTVNELKEANAVALMKFGNLIGVI